MNKIDDLTDFTISFFDNWITRQKQQAQSQPPEDDEQEEPYCCSDCEACDRPSQDYDPQHGNSFGGSGVL